ncbi:MAG: TIGR02206 family membrane protein [Ignavibacteriales bacterium]
MREFVVDEVPGISFNLFSITHFVCLSILLVGLILIYINRHKIEKLSKPTKTKIKIIMVSIWLLNRLVYIGSYMYCGIYDWRTNLPLHFCFITGYLFVIAILFNKKDLLKVVYFFAFMGPLTATIWPDLRSSFDYLIFYEFFISHHLFVLFIFFLFYMENLKIGKNDIYKGIFWANVIFLGAFVFNNYFGTNYIMSEELPDHILKLYPFLKSINYPIIILELTGLTVAFLSYIPVYLRNKENKRLQDKESLL